MKEELGTETAITCAHPQLGIQYGGTEKGMEILQRNGEKIPSDFFYSVCSNNNGKIRLCMKCLLDCNLTG